MPAKLIFPDPLSFPGTLKLHVDFTGPLSYDSETLSGTSPMVSSSDTGLVTISLAAPNSAQLTNSDGTLAAIGKAVEWVCTSVKASTGNVDLAIAWDVGGGGTKLTYQAELNLEQYVTQ